MLMSKRDRLHQAAQGLQALCCPVCGNSLRREGETYSCGKHPFTVNKKGFLNFLSAPAPSCYDAELFQARRRVFDAGCYDAVADAIVELLPPKGTQKLLDAGCGDGWYLQRILQSRPDWHGAGVDISRDAIAQAADHPCTALWCVADLRRLPFADQSFTAVLDVLTPASYSEFQRVLTQDGLLIKVFPGGEYLREIRAKRGMAPYEEGQVDAYLQEHGEVADRRRVTVTLPVTSQLWRDFVFMTPLNQDLPPAEKEALAENPADTVTVDLHVVACRLKKE